MSEQPQISFGTDGWRAVIADEYTFQNVRACALALAIELKSSGRAAQGVAVGYDTRFLSDRFAESVADVLVSHGIPVHISDRPIPTPALSYAVTTLRNAAGVMITASHNPAEWNGFKVKSSLGGSASPQEVERIEAHLPNALEAIDSHTETPKTQDVPRKIDMFHPYIEQLKRCVDVDLIRSVGFKIAVDSMHGSGAGAIARILENSDSQVEEIRADINPSFPGMKQPEPVEENLAPLISSVSASQTDIGIATDGDADRLGAVAEDGTYLNTLELFTMLFHHLKARRNMHGGAVSTITMTNMMETLAEHHSVPFIRTPVGFKYIGPVMIQNDCVIGGEESGGYAFRFHIPERDGPLSALVLLESMAMSGLSPKQLLAEIHHIAGPRSYRRTDIQFEPQERQRLEHAVQNLSPTHLAENEVQQRDAPDGTRLIMQDGSWAVARMSGTEPLLRIYVEARNPDQRDGILTHLKQLLEV